MKLTRNLPLLLLLFITILAICAAVEEDVVQGEKAGERGEGGRDQGVADGDGVGAGVENVETPVVAIEDGEEKGDRFEDGVGETKVVLGEGESGDGEILDDGEFLVDDAVVVDEGNAVVAEDVVNEDEGNKEEGKKENKEGMDYIEYLAYEGNMFMKEEGGLRKAIEKLRIASAFGHSAAMVTLALIHLGESNPEIHNVGKAVELLRLSEQYGQPEALGTLGFLHASGIADRHGVEFNMAKAIVYWKLAAENNYLPAVTSLGYRYRYGVDVRKSCRFAARYYKAAGEIAMADSKYIVSEESFLNRRPPIPDGFEPVGALRLEDTTEGNSGSGSDGSVSRKLEEEMSYFAQEAVYGDTRAQFTLGVLNMLSDRKKSEKMLARAARNGHATAYALLGYFALKQKKLEKALHHFRISAQQNCNIGLYGLGMMHYYGLGGAEESATIAAAHLQKAAVLDSGEAGYQIGIMYLTGDGVQQNAQTARQLLQRAAVVGNLPAKYQLAIMELKYMDYANEKACYHTVSLLQEIVDESEWRQVLNAGAEAYENGEMFRSLYRYLQAAHAGIEIAQSNAAFLHERMIKALEQQSGLFANLDNSFSLGEELEHWDVDRHARAALRLYEMSGSQGRSTSFVQAGDLMYERDIWYSRSAYERASKLDDAEALFNLGWMKSQGIAGEQNRDEALTLWQRASEQDENAYLPTVIAFNFIELYNDNKFGFGRFVDFLKTPLGKLSGVQNVEMERSNSNEYKEKSRGGWWTWDMNRDSIIVLGLSIALWMIRKVMLDRRRPNGEQAGLREDRVE